MKEIIYQMLPRLWGSYGPGGNGTFADVDEASLRYIRSLGAGAVWYTGVLRHATKAHDRGCIPSHPQFVKGEAGSPYAITDYYDVNPYLAADPERRMEEFEALIARTHAAGLKVIIDFVPNHVARDYGRFGTSPAGGGTLGMADHPGEHWRPDNDFFYYPGTPLRLPNEEAFLAEVRALSEGRFDFPYALLPAWLVDACRRGEDPAPYAALLAPFREDPAKATGNHYGAEPGINDWYETVKLNYCDFRTPTWDKMRDILLFWAGKGVDGFRCDMVELVPPAFFAWVIPELKKAYPQLCFIAEVYQKSLYRQYIHEVGFDLLYDKSGLYDALRAIVEKQVADDGTPVELWQSAQRITGNWQQLDDMQPRVLHFLENHDEQRIASSFFAGRPENAYAALAVSLLMSTAPFLLYAGQEVGERGMDNEPFSGINGRTSIFDWWQVGSLQQLWRDIHGEKGPDSPLLQRYCELLRLSVTERAFAEGRCYDLCYCNIDSPGFDRDRHYAFLRSDGEKTWLVVANFATRAARIRLLIPADAYAYLQTEAPGPEVLEVAVPAYDYTLLAL